MIVFHIHILVFLCLSCPFWIRNSDENFIYKFISHTYPPSSFSWSSPTACGIKIICYWEIQDHLRLVFSEFCLNILWCRMFTFLKNDLVDIIFALCWDPTKIFFYKTFFSKISGDFFHFSNNQFWPSLLWKKSFFVSNHSSWSSSITDLLNGSFESWIYGIAQRFKR